MSTPKFCLHCNHIVRTPGRGTQILAGRFTIHRACWETWCQRNVLDRQNVWARAKSVR